MLAAIGVAVAYQLANDSLDWLWVASALLVVQWFGDSLDGTLARVRKIERPTYGYYLDHLVDAIATAAIGIGLGLSPLMLLSIGTLIVVAYLILSINVYLESFAFGRFSIGYGYVGPTEIRLILIALNTVVALGAGLDFVVADLAADRLRPDRARDRGDDDRPAARPRHPQSPRAGEEGARREASLRPFSRRLRESTPAVPLHFGGHRNKFNLRFGKRKTATEAKSSVLFEGDRQSFDRAKATREAGRARSAPGPLFFARVRGGRPSPSLPSPVRRGSPPARDGLPPRVARPGRIRGASAEVETPDSHLC